jgi:hypothetical protein
MITAEPRRKQTPEHAKNPKNKRGKGKEAKRGGR